MFFSVIQTRTCGPSPSGRLQEEWTLLQCRRAKRCDKQRRRPMPCLGGPLTKAEEAAYKVKHNNRKRGGQDQGVKQTKPRAPLTAEQQKIVADNMGMICRIAGKRTQQLRACGFNIDYDTVLSGCMLGAVDAAYRFDESRGIRFSTFASRLVWNQVNDDLRQSDETYHRNGGRRGPHNDCRVITESQIKKTCTENRQPESLFARKQADFAGFDD